MNHVGSQAQSLQGTLFLGPEKRHKIYIFLCTIAAVTLAVTLAAYGWDYYSLDPEQRPFSLKHHYLKPSGKYGLDLGIVGLSLFALIYLYPLRKYWPALQRIGKTKHWFDFHVMMGLIAPVIISFHCAFKVHGFAGMAYWMMIGLTVSGIVGKYFYAQIPRSIDAAEMSLKEMQSMSAELTESLRAQNIVKYEDIEPLFRLPDSEAVKRMPVLLALAEMTWLDITRPFRVWAVRRRTMRFGGRLVTLGGILRTRQYELERVIALASHQASLAKRILFLAKTHRVFHLWHVVHRPFSISFAVFVIIHVTVVVWLGYF